MTVKCKIEVRYLFEVEVPLVCKTESPKDPNGFFVHSCNEDALSEASAKLPDVQPLLKRARKKKKFTKHPFDVEFGVFCRPNSKTDFYAVYQSKEIRREYIEQE